MAGCAAVLCCICCVLRGDVEGELADHSAHAASASVSVAAPGGPDIQHSPPPADVIAAAAAAVAHVRGGGDDEEGDLICVICLHECLPSDEIWCCDTCSLPVHLGCMRSWLEESEAKRRFGRCPGCTTDVNHHSLELAYSCWCKRVVWSNDGGPEGVAPAHSCGMQCSRGTSRRSNGCDHPCQDTCHRGRCAPCGHTRSQDRCVGNHVTYAPYACGSEAANKCTLACGAVLPCGHQCTAPCHAGPHAPCMTPVSKSCACGKRGAAAASSSAAPADGGNGVIVPCSQTMVQCDVPCGRLRSCSQHACDRRCHAGECQELTLVSAWNKTSWMKAGPAGGPGGAPAPPATASPAAAEPASDDFPALASSVAPLVPRRTPSATPAASSASGGFRSCGKPCGRRRACGHPCVQTCHAISSSAVTATAVSASSAGGESKENEEAKQQPVASSSATLSAPSFSRSSSAATAGSECELLPCTQSVHVSCPCGRKSQDLRCHELTSSRGARLLCLCDRVCAVHIQGRVFGLELARTSTEREDPAAFGELDPKLMLPFPVHLLALLCGGSIAASAGCGTSHALASEAQFLRKTEAAMRKFVIDLAATIDREEQVANGSCAPTPSGARTPRTPKFVSSTALAAASAATNVRHLFLSGLTPARRVLVAQLALMCNLHFNQESGYLEAPTNTSMAAHAAAAAATANAGAIAAAASSTLLLDRTASQQRAAQGSDGEERKEDGSEAAASLEVLPDPLSTSRLAASPSLIAPPAVSFFLPALSLTDAADLHYRRCLHLPTLCTAESWPASMRLRLSVEGGLDSHNGMTLGGGNGGNGGGGGGGGSGDDPIASLQRWLAPFATRSRTCWLNASAHLGPSGGAGGANCSTVSVLFGSALTARQCYSHLRRSHASELAGARIQLEPPAASAAPFVRAEVAREELEQEQLRAQETATRRAHEIEFAAIQARQARHRAANPLPSASILPGLPKSQHAVSAVRSQMVGHSKLQVKSANIFQLLGDEEEDE